LITRYKTFDATGIAPNGRLYAGDLNAIQDAVAAQSDFAQVIDVSSLRIGDTGISLSKFGTAEAQFSGKLRAANYVMGVQGIVSNPMTTTARNALASGAKPPAMIIFNSTTARHEYNAGTDAVPDWQPIAGGTGGGGTLTGALGSRPAASSVVAGTTYYASDQDVLYRSDGATWTRIYTPAGATMLWFAAAAPTGWVKYDGSNLPSSTGIYADLATHLGTTTTPDTRGRMPTGVGTHADVASVGLADGLSVGSRRPKHKHAVGNPTISTPSITQPTISSPVITITDPGHFHTVNNPAQTTGAGAGSSGALAVVGAPENTGTKTTGITAALASAPIATGAALSSAPTASGGTVGPQTGSEPTDSPGFITCVFIAKL
jgi:hypothetical protein